MTEEQIREISLQLTPIGEPFLENLFTQSGALYYRFLYRLVRKLRPELVVELGIQDAYSTAYLAAAGPESRILAIDSDPQDVRIIVSKYANIEFRRERSESPIVLNSVQNQSVDICFFDTIHEYDQVSLETKLWLPKMRPGGIMIYDDISLNEGMKKFWDELDLTKISLPYLHWSGFGCALAPKN